MKLKEAKVPLYTFMHILQCVLRTFSCFFTCFCESYMSLPESNLELLTFKPIDMKAIGQYISDFHVIQFMKLYKVVLTFNCLWINPVMCDHS